MTQLPQAWRSTRRNQRGIGALGVVLVIVVLGVLGFTGWFVYHSSQQTNDTLNATDQSSSTTAKPSKTTSSTTKQDDTATMTIQTLVLSKTPKDLQATVVATTQQASASCVKNDALVDVDGKTVDPDVKYLASGFAETGIGCEGTEATIFAKKGSNWAVVDATQMLYSCDKLKQYSVPVDFLKAVSPDGSATCSTGSGSETYKL